MDWLTQILANPNPTLHLLMKIKFALTLLPLLATGLLAEPSVTVVPTGFESRNPTFLPVTKAIYEKIKKEVPKKMEPYTETVSDYENNTFEMLPIPGGQFTMGSPESEAERGEDESPQKKIKIKPFWMAKTETTWALYRIYMDNGKGRNKDGSLNRDSDLLTFEAPEVGKDPLIDVISQPTPPYTPMHFGLADNAGYAPEYPALAMTQHAASKFCEWLSAQTGHYYRLPTEAEWEYACRAGTTTAYSFGEDASKIDEYAWHGDNSDFSYQKAGTKKPNPWGLHDMHGNVSEWTLDAYLPDYKTHPENSPLMLSKKRYPRVTRGGSFEVAPENLRSAAREFSEQWWKSEDPQEPKSIWFHTDAQWVGFRIIRPLHVPDVEEMHLLWNTGPGDRF